MNISPKDPLINSHALFLSPPLKNELHLPIIYLTLSPLRPRLAFIPNDWVKHNFGRIVWSIVCIAFAPVVANRICKDITSSVELSRNDATANLRVAFETVLSILVPEVKGTVAPCSAECAMHWVE